MRAPLVALALVACSSFDSAPETRLASGSLAGLQSYAPGGDVATLFRVQGDELVINGPTFGYLKTERAFGDMTMTFEWKWVVPGNSGIFLFVNAPDQIWPRTVEVQLFPDHAGDLLALTGFVMRDRKSGAALANLARSGGAEKPLGEWNRATIDSHRGLLKVTLNDVLANEVDIDPNERGAIAFEAEGGEIHFRSVYVRE